MAYETKVILTMIADKLASTKNVKECYNFVVKAANAEGLKLPPYHEAVKAFETEKSID